MLERSSALLELLLIIANIGTAVVIVPILRRQFEELSIGYVAARIIDDSVTGLPVAVTLQARGASAERLSELGRVEKLNGSFRIYPTDKSRAAQLAQDVVEMVNLHGWKVEGMYSERGELDEVFRRITLPDTIKERKSS